MSKKKGRYPLARVHFQISRFESVVVPEVTPPELAVLIAVHRGDQGDPVVALEPLEESVERSVQEEKARLVSVYGRTVVESVFPGAIPNMPETFDEARGIGAEATVPKRNLVDYSLSAPE